MGKRMFSLDMSDSGEDFDYGKFMKRLISEKLQE